MGSLDLNRMSKSMSTGKIVSQELSAKYKTRRGRCMYIDPNTGGMLFQVLAALFAVLSGLILFYSGKIPMFFAQLRRLIPEGSRQGDDQTNNNDAEEVGDS